MTMKTIRWQQDIAADFVDCVTEDGKKVKKLAITTENSPAYELRVAGEKVDPWFLFDKLLRDFSVHNKCAEFYEPDNKCWFVSK